MRSRMILLGVMAWLLMSGVQADPISDGLTAWRAGDYGGAHRHWQVAAEAGDAQAMFLLSDLYSHGKGVPAHLVQAVRRLKAAAKAGHPPACYNLGDRYLNGTGVARDPAQAAWWYEQAAGQGSSRARQALAVLQRAGLTPDQELLTAGMSAEPSVEPAVVTMTTSSDAPASLLLLPAEPSKPGMGADPIALTLGPDWLRRQPPEGYTLQVFASPDLAGVTRFLGDY